jgi:dGTPase
LNGYNKINRLLDFLWMGINQREDYFGLDSKRITPFAAYVYSRISKNYRRVFEGSVIRYHTDVEQPIRYKEMQLLTDMISGMTDRFCIELCNDLTEHYVRMENVDGTPA